MLIWIVNPFDPLPGDPEQEGRYATLAKVLAVRGHEVIWWTSSFSHRFKRPVDQEAIWSACRQCGIRPRFISSPPYSRNVGLARWRNHAVLTRNFRAAAANATCPAVIVVSSPPPMLAAAAAKIGQCRGARVMIDVQDRWPDVFLSVAPRWSRAALHPAIWALRRSVRKAAAACDAIVGVADAYVEDFLRETRAPKITATIPLGVDLAAFDAAAKAGRCPEFTKPAGRVWLAYSGSLNRSYDFLTILHAAGRVAPDLRSKFHIFFTSRGELADRAARVVRAQKLAAVSLTGFLPFEKWAYLLTQCDAGFNASLPASFIYLPNKVFYYFAAGVAVLNTISGQCSRILRAAGCGLDYRPGDVNGCVAAIEQVIRDDAGRTAMARASRRLAETTYDRKLLFPQYAALIEKLGKCAPSAEPRAV